MLNRSILVGYLKEVKELPDKKSAIISIAIKNTSKTVDTIPVIISGSVYNALRDIELNSCIGLKGELGTRDSQLFLKADQLTFLSKNPDEKDETT